MTAKEILIKNSQFESPQDDSYIDFEHDIFDGRVSVILLAMEEYAKQYHSDKINETKAHDKAHDKVHDKVPNELTEEDLKYYEGIVIDFGTETGFNRDCHLLTGGFLDTTNVKINKKNNMETTKQLSKLCIETAAQAWCKPKTSSKVMDEELALAFAEILDEIWSKPWLGNATTKELLAEISARVDLDYKTVEN